MTLTTMPPEANVSPGTGGYDYDPRLADAFLADLPDDEAGIAAVMLQRMSGVPDTSAPEQPEQQAQPEAESPDHGKNSFRRYFGGVEKSPPPPDDGDYLFRINYQGYDDRFARRTSALAATGQPVPVTYAQEYESAGVAVLGTDEEGDPDLEEFFLQRIEEARVAAENAKVHTIRNWLGGDLKFAGIGRDTVCDLQLAVSELLTNAIRHAQWKEVAVYRSGGRLVLTVADNDMNDKGEQAISPGIHYIKNSATSDKPARLSIDEPPEQAADTAKGDDTNGRGDFSDPDRAMHGRGLGLISGFFGSHGYQRVYHPGLRDFTTTKTVWVMTNEET